MSTDAVGRLFVRRFINNFGAPTVIDVDAFYAEYERALGGTDDDILREAAAHVIDHHSYPQRWPTVAECKTAVDHIATERALARARRNWGKKDEQPRQEPTPESRARVEALMRATMADFKKGGFSLVKEQAKWAARQNAKAAGKAPTAEQLEAAAEAAGETRVAMPDVSRPAWEERFGKYPSQIPIYQAVPMNEPGRPPDVSHRAWHERYGYKAGEIDRRFPDDKLRDGEFDQ